MKRRTSFSGWRVTKCGYPGGVKIGPPLQKELSPRARGRQASFSFRQRNSSLVGPLAVITLLLGGAFLCSCVDLTTGGGAGQTQPQPSPTSMASQTSTPSQASGASGAVVSTRELFTVHHWWLFSLGVDEQLEAYWPSDILQQDPSSAYFSRNTALLRGLQYDEYHEESWCIREKEGSLSLMYLGNSAVTVAGSAINITDTLPPFGGAGDDVAILTGEIGPWPYDLVMTGTLYAPADEAPYMEGTFDLSYEGSVFVKGTWTAEPDTEFGDQWQDRWW